MTSIISQSERPRLYRALGVPELDKELTLAIAEERAKYRREMKDARQRYEQALRRLRASYETKAHVVIAHASQTGALEIRPGIYAPVGAIVEEWANRTPWLTLPSWRRTGKKGLVQMHTAAMIAKTATRANYYRPEVGQLGIRLFHKHSGQLGRKWVYPEDYGEWWKEGEEPEWR